MHNTNTNHTQFAIVESIKTLINNTENRIVENKHFDLRIESYSRQNNTPTCFGVFSYTSHQLQSLYTTSDEVLRRYTQLAKCLPVHERFALGFAGIMLNSVIESDKYQADLEKLQPIKKDFYQFVAWMVSAELNLNTGRAADCDASPFLPGSYINLSQLIDAFQQKKYSITDHEYFNFLGEACETFLMDFATRYKGTAQWDHAWEIVIRQIGVDLVSFSTMAPSAPIPESQGAWLNALVTRPSGNELTNTDFFSLYCLSSFPTLDDTYHFITACDTTKPVKPDTLDFPSALGLQVILLSLRTFATPFDMLQLFWNALPFSEKTTYLSTVFEGHVLAYHIFGCPEIIPENSVLKHSIQPVSSQAVRKLRDFTLRNLPMHTWHAIQTIGYSAFAAPLHLKNMGREIEAELRAGGAFKDALTDTRIKQLADTLKQLIRESGDARALVLTSGSHASTAARVFYNTLITDINTAQQLSSNHDAYNALCNVYFRFSTAEAIQNRTHAQQMQEWESGELTVVTSFFPSLFTHEIAIFVNNNLAQKRASTLIAASIAFLGVIGVPYLHTAVDHINHMITGKTFSGLHTWILINEMLMGFLAFQALMLMTTSPYGKNSLFMSMFTTLAQDPMKVAAGIAVLLGGAHLLMSNLTVDAIRELSCDARFSRTGLLVLPETCISELVEALHFASFPPIIEMLVMYKIVMYFRTLFSQNRHATPNLAALMQSSSLDATELRQVTLHPELLQMIMWRDLSTAHDALGRAQVGAFVRAVNAINQSESISTDEKRALTRQLYRHYMQSPKPVIVDFMTEVVCSMALSLAYSIPLVPTESLLNKRSLRWNLRSCGDVTKWLASLGFLACAQWWLFMFNRKHDGAVLSFLISMLTGGESHPDRANCISSADCLRFDNPLLTHNHSQYEAFVEHCRETITSCDCLPEGAAQQALDEIFHVVKLASVFIIIMAAAKYWITWNSTLTQQARQQNKEYWKTIGSQASQTIVDGLFMFVYLLASFKGGLTDLALMASNYAATRCVRKPATAINPTSNTGSESTRSLKYNTLEEESPTNLNEDHASSSTPKASSKSLTTKARPIAYSLVNRLFAKSSRPDLGDLIMTVGATNATADENRPPAV